MGPKLDHVKLKTFMFQQNTLLLLRIQNSLEIALSLTVSEIFAIFHFSQKFKMAAKSCKI